MGLFLTPNSVQLQKTTKGKYCSFGVCICVYQLYTPASCSCSPLKDVSRKKQQPCIVYLCRIRLPPTWWNIISMLIFTPRLQVCCIFKHLVLKKKREELFLFSVQIGWGFEGRHETRTSFSKQFRTLEKSFSGGKAVFFFSLFVLTNGMT